MFSLDLLKVKVLKVVHGRGQRTTEESQSWEMLIRETKT